MFGATSVSVLEVDHSSISSLSHPQTSRIRKGSAIHGDVESWRLEETVLKKCYFAQFIPENYHRTPKSWMGYL